MAQKSVTVLSFLISAIVSALVIDSHFVPSARAQKTGTEPSSPSLINPPTAIGQKTYPTIASDDWLYPFSFDKLAFNTPVLVDNKDGKQRLAVLSRDTLNPPKCTPTSLESCNISVNKTGREAHLVTQWSQNELRAWAYEKSEDTYTRKTDSGFSREFRLVFINPSPEINAGLYIAQKWEMLCDSESLGCRLIPQPPKPPLESNLQVPRYEVSPPKICFPGSPIMVERRLPDDTWQRCPESKSDQISPPTSVTTPKPSLPKVKTEPQLTIYVGSQQFNLDGKDGIFPINRDLAKALREAKSPVKIITPKQ